MSDYYDPDRESGKKVRLPSGNGALDRMKIAPDGYAERMDSLYGGKDTDFSNI